MSKATSARRKAVGMIHITKLYNSFVVVRNGLSLKKVEKHGAHDKNKTYGVPNCHC